METSPNAAESPVVVQDLAERLLQEALGSPHGRAAELIVHDGELRQTMVALTADTELNEHNPPHAATLHVLSGRVRVGWDGGGQVVDAGELAQLAKTRHNVTADEDSVFLLTTVTGV